MQTAHVSERPITHAVFRDENTYLSARRPFKLPPS